MNIKSICKELQLGALYKYEALTSGNINVTYCVFTKDGSELNEYLLQRINKNVFKNPVAVMDNIVKVTEYIAEHKTRSKLCPLCFNKTKDGKSYVVDEEGNYWRARQFLDCVTYDTTDDLKVIEEAGFAFGEFQTLLDGFDASVLYESIPDFHNTEKRINDLKNAIEYSSSKRKEEAAEEIEYVLSNESTAVSLCEMLKRGEIPLRVTHNDTKCNNVVFNKHTHEALAVIDLDTIMPGLTAYDFGDGARSICCTTEEDEADLDKVKFRLDKFEAFTKGYLGKLGHILTENEKKTLGISCYVMTLELASRFLEDYLNGDTYFKINYEKQNLLRTRCQIALAKDIMNKINDINAIVKKYSD